MVEPEPTAELNRRWACRLVRACLSARLDHFFLASGSRCAPLTLAVASCAEARVIQHFDERGLAYACLGYGEHLYPALADFCELTGIRAVAL